nr:hypothetical protein Iba_chr06bCG2000 [Ipomoea batatas]GMD07014.1 hypothetical protein Iba_chr06cCG3110 [Ipomoea batatas]GMD08889.1 hypothetical protein Iba_chr06dCG2870 [Ipomoea batatas]GMD11312.1 hypothetical protein Iba_chr06fCG2510 [Ipomoea batatas]
MRSYKRISPCDRTRKPTLARRRGRRRGKRVFRRRATSLSPYFRWRGSKFARDADREEQMRCVYMRMKTRFAFARWITTR